MGITEAQRRAHDKYFSKAYKQVKLSMPNDEAEALEIFCTEHGYSKAGFIRRAIRELMDRETQHKDDLDAAIRLVAEATGETSEQLITRHLTQNLHHDIDCLGGGLFEMVGGYDRDKIDMLNEVVSNATGFHADDWMIDNGSTWSEDTRDYVRAQQDSQHRILWPGEVTPAGDILSHGSEGNT